MEKDIIIAVMGMTGIGKSTFIKNITGNDDIAVGHGLFSETSVVKGYIFINDNIRYTLVDTPGFDDTFESDPIITDKILSWLDSSYRSGMRLNGILYLHSIAVPRMQGSAFDNLDMFRKLCGTNALSHVVLATTFWSSTETMLGENREKELAQNDAFWGRMMKNGSRVLRLENSAISAMKALWEVSKGSKIMLQAQEEMAKGGRASERTTAAHFIASITTDGRGARYTERLKKQKEEEIKQMERLQEMQVHLNSIDDILAKVVKQADLERMRLSRSRQSYYKSHKCHCQLVGRAKCTNCRRKVGKVFYHCCFCNVGAFLHCAECGNQCQNENHPEMLRQEAYCTVM